MARYKVLFALLAILIILYTITIISSAQTQEEMSKTNRVDIDYEEMDRIFNENINLFIEEVLNRNPIRIEDGGMVLSPGRDIQLINGIEEYFIKPMGSIYTQKYPEFVLIYLHENSFVYILSKLRKGNNILTNVDDNRLVLLYRAKYPTTPDYPNTVESKLSIQISQLTDVSLSLSNLDFLDYKLQCTSLNVGKKFYECNDQNFVKVSECRSLSEKKYFVGDNGEGYHSSFEWSSSGKWCEDDEICVSGYLGCVKKDDCNSGEITTKDTPNGCFVYVCLNGHWENTGALCSGTAPSPSEEEQTGEGESNGDEYPSPR